MFFSQHFGTQIVAELQRAISDSPCPCSCKSQPCKDSDHVDFVVRARQAACLGSCTSADDEVPALEGPTGDTEGTDSTKSHRREPEAVATEAGFS